MVDTVAASHFRSNLTDTVNHTRSIACELGPLCIIEPASAEDVSKALTIITFVGSKFAVRSGGHNPGVGFSGVSHDGILIDMRKLNEVVPSLDQSVVSIGPGSRWGDVYSTLEPLNKTVVGGRLTDVGVGGYMLGGGLSHFSSVYGLAVNHVVRYEVCIRHLSYYSSIIFIYFHAYGCSTSNDWVI